MLDNYLGVPITILRFKQKIQNKFRELGFRGKLLTMKTKMQKYFELNIFFYLDIIANVQYTIYKGKNKKNKKTKRNK